MNLIIRIIASLTELILGILIIVKRKKYLINSH